MIGLEGEHLGIRPDGRPSTWEQTEKAFRWLADHQGYSPDPAAGIVVIRAKDGASISPEPGCQVELSDRPYANLNEMAAGLERRQAELVEATQAAGFSLVTMGFQPMIVAPLAVPRRPGARYEVMRELSSAVERKPEDEVRLLDGLYNRGHGMMHKSATMQPNVNYMSEEDAERKTQVIAATAWPLSAIFNNSPYLNGRLTHVQSVRNENNRESMGGKDGVPYRTGALFGATWQNGRGNFYDRVAYHLIHEIPMFAAYDQDGGFIDMRGKNFAAHIASGKATSTDAANQGGGMFYADVRPGQGRIEGRSLDKGPLEMQKAMGALYFGLTHDVETARAVIAETKDLDFRRLHRDVPRIGLDTRLREGRTATVADLDRVLVSFARASLKKRGYGEEKLLDPIDVVLKTEENWAQRLKRRCGDDWRKAARIMDSAVNDGKGVSLLGGDIAPSAPVAYFDMRRVGG
jgi:glutamate--cysteine ligase